MRPENMVSTLRLKEFRAHRVKEECSRERALWSEQRPRVGKELVRKLENNTVRACGREVIGSGTCRPLHGVWIYFKCIKPVRNFDKQRSEMISLMYLTLGTELNNRLRVGTRVEGGHWLKS